MPEIDEKGAASSATVNARPSGERREIPAVKRTTLGYYFTARQAYARIKDNRNAVLFIDVRARAEVQLLGMASIADANVPFIDFTDFYAWDSDRKKFKQAQNPEFVAEVERRLAQKKLSKTSTIVLISRSGLRSARAVDLLAAEGYTKVYHVIDGFEGDEPDDWPGLSRRPENGWKAAGLPWSYRLDPNKMFKVQTGEMPR